MVKDARIGASSEYRTRYRSFELRYRSLDFDIGCGKDPRIGASTDFRTLYRSFVLRYRSPQNIVPYIEVFYLDIEVMTSISKFLHPYIEES